MRFFGGAGDAAVSRVAVLLIVPPGSRPVGSGGCRARHRGRPCDCASPLCSLSSRAPGAAQCAAMRLRRSAPRPSVARQILLLQVAGRAGARRRRRSPWRRTTPGATPRDERHATAPWRSPRPWPTPPPWSAPSAPPDPAARRAAVRRGGAPRHRRRLRRGDGPRPHPLQPPRPGLIGKPFVGDLGTAPAGGSSPRSTPARSGRRCARWSRCATRGRVVALVSVGITVAPDRRAAAPRPRA